MGTSRHTIELNGQTFDAVTGQLLRGVAAKRQAKTKAAPSGGTRIDGFMKPKSVAGGVAPTHHTKLKHAKTTPKPHAKQVQRSKTLMRSAVHKPAVKKEAPAHPSVSKSIHLSPVRLQRAHSVSKSALISKFGGHAHVAISPQIAPLPVEAPPLHDHQSLGLSEQIALAVKPAQHKLHTFEQALQKATSHQQPKFKKKTLSHRVARKLRVKPTAVKLGTSVAAVAILAGFIAYQNVPQLAMRVAATRAGISAQLPGYRPAGFAMSKQIQYSPGQVRLSYTSNSDQRAFHVTQKATDWDEQRLLREHVAVNNRPYQAYNDEQKTIYIYDGSNAAWIANGVLYEIEGTSALSSDQLLRLATSI